jgi:undecaprenyl-diphosphatase
MSPWRWSSLDRCNRRRVTNASSAVYVTLALVVARRLRRRRQRVLVVGGGLALVLVIGLTRLYLGVHYPTDVLAGWALGLGVALACGWLEGRWAAPHGVPSAGGMP